VFTAARTAIDKGTPADVRRVIGLTAPRAAVVVVKADAQTGVLMSAMISAAMNARVMKGCVHTRPRL